MRERLDVARLQDAIATDDGKGEGTSKRDDDTYYFESYGANGEHSILSSLKPIHRRDVIHVPVLTVAQTSMRS